MLAPAAALIFGVAALVTWLVMPLVMRAARAVGAVDIPNEAKHVHRGVIPRWGGVGLTLGFVVAAAIGVPLGILMGAYKPIEAFFEPFISFARYLPASAFIPLLILWAGLG